MKASPPSLKHEIAVERARAPVSDLHDKMEDERGGGASVVEAAKKLGLTAVTIEAVDRSGPRAGRPAGDRHSAGPRPGRRRPSPATSASTTIRSSRFNGGYRLVRRARHHARRATAALDEVKDQVEARWRDDQITSRLRPRRREMVQKLNQGGKLADEAAGLGTQSRYREPASSATPPCRACPPA